jgi:hypothetical protein
MTEHMHERQNEARNAKTGYGFKLLRRRNVENTEITRKKLARKKQSQLDADNVESGLR